jgi:hypothetical protein
LANRFAVESKSFYFERCIARVMFAGWHPKNYRGD